MGNRTRGKKKRLSKNLLEVVQEKVKNIRSELKEKDDLTFEEMEKIVAHFFIPFEAGDTPLKSDLVFRDVLKIILLRQKVGECKSYSDVDEVFSYALKKGIIKKGTGATKDTLIVGWDEQKFCLYLQDAEGVLVSCDEDTTPLPRLLTNLCKRFRKQRENDKEYKEFSEGLRDNLTEGATVNDLRCGKNLTMLLNVPEYTHKGKVYRECTLKVQSKDYDVRVLGVEGKGWHQIKGFITRKTRISVDEFDQHSRGPSDKEEYALWSTLMRAIRSKRPLQQKKVS